MKKIKFLPLFLIVCLFLASVTAVGASALEPPDVSSPNAVVMDRLTGEVLWSRAPDERVYPASTTKIMTVLLAVEAVEQGKAALNDQVTAGASMTFDLIADGSSAGIQVGETMSLESLMYCAMISSANEACNVIAEYIGGSIDKFVRMMNDRAAELGCTGTHFTNTHGLPDDNHYSTPSDFCLITMEATSHDLFMKLCNADSVEIPATNLSEERTLNNSNALLSDKSIYGSGYVYEYAAGVKTGHTNAAGYCLVSTAEKNDVKLLAVVFGGAQTQNADGVMVYTNFTDSIALYDWVFNNYSYQEVVKSAENVASAHVELGSDTDTVNLRPETSVTALLPNDYSANEFATQVTIFSERDGKTLEAPISAGEVLGEIRVTRAGLPYATVNLVAAASVDLSRMQYIRSSVSDTLHSTPVIVTAIVLAVLFLGYLALVINYRVKRSRHKKAVQAARAERARAAAGGGASPARPAQQPRQPAAPRPPKIDYFADITGGDTDDGSPEDKAISGMTTPVPSVKPPARTEQDQSDIDYFEEFFRRK